MGLYFEEFSLGQEFASRGRTITETDIVNFAGLSGDFVELHTNEEFAKQTPAGRRIAHGALIFSISTGLMTQMNLINDSVLAFYGVDKLRFTKPVFIGDTVRVAKKVTDLLGKGERGVVTFETTILNQRGETVQVYHDKLLLKRRA
jgi:3-hydroxybutyryl-CoA dehydratase